MIDDLFETISAEEEQQSKTLLMKHQLNERIQKIRTRSNRILPVK